MRLPVKSEFSLVKRPKNLLNRRILSRAFEVAENGNGLRAQQLSIKDDAPDERDRGKQHRPKMNARRSCPGK